MQRIIPKPEWPPHYCIASLKSEDSEGFIDTGLSPGAIDPHIILSVSYVKEQARQLGMADREVTAKLEERLYAALDRVNELEQLVEDREALLDATDAVRTYARSRKPKKELVTSGR